MPSEPDINIHIWIARSRKVAWWIECSFFSYFFLDLRLLLFKLASFFFQFALFLLRQLANYIYIKKKKKFTEQKMDDKRSRIIVAYIFSLPWLLRPGWEFWLWVQLSTKKPRLEVYVQRRTWIELYFSFFFLLLLWHDKLGFQKVIAILIKFLAFWKNEIRNI